jgi:two-component system CheB/CheR fusion protein
LPEKRRQTRTAFRKSAEKSTAQKPQEKRKENDRATKDLVVVGIGASAGGLEAFQQFLKNLPVDTGKAFVLIQHLDPTHKSSLVEILSRSTRMPVQEAEGNAPLKPDHVYVIPPNSFMTISEGRLQLTSRNQISGAAPYPIDRFLESLAQEFKERAIGVILSGTASDGTRGLKAIKANGGITFAQDEKSAKYPDMPRNAGVVADFIMSPDRLAQELGKIIQPVYAAGIQREKREKQRKSATQQSPLEEIFTILRKSSGVDLSNYRGTTMERRVLRRMSLMKQHSLKDYVEYLRKTSSEVHALYRDIFIHVTTFFREPEKYDWLKAQIYPRILKAKSPREPIRVWVVGCSSGEEVYSLAITLLEFLGVQASDALLQIFGSDIDPEIVEFARRGIYPHSIEQDVSAERLKKFFTKTNDHYQINKNVRELCVFAKHDVLGDPAFSRVDLISCCNVLIYFTPDSQANLFKTFHYALKSPGYLILGKSEAVPMRSGLFEQIDKTHRIYMRKQAPQSEMPPFSKRTTRQMVAQYESNEKPASVFDIQKAADNLALQEYDHRGLVIDSKQNILHFRGDVSAFLKPSSGEASLTLGRILSEELWLPLRGMIEASKKRQTRQQKKITTSMNHSLTDLTLEVIPFAHPGSGERFYLILIKDTTSDKTKKLTSERKNGKDKGDGRNRYVLSLERELTDVKGYMRFNAQQQDAINSQLNFANEELQSANEELQSLNEELETSKEELESGNEELNTLNEELRNRNMQLTSLNSQMAELAELNEAILRTMREPLLLLDSDLMIKSANRAFYHTFKTTKSETENLYLYELGHKQWDIAKLRTGIEEVLSKRSDLRDYEVESDFPVIGHRIMSLNGSRILQKEGKEELILLSIEDITHRKELSAALHIKIQEIHHRIKNNLQVISSLLNMQGHMQGNPEITQALRDSQNRIKSMALIHEKLYVSNHEGKIVFKEYVLDLLASIFRSLGLDKAKISTKVDVKDVFLDMDVAVPCGLILNELVTNSLIHAFNADDGGQIRIEMKPEIQNDGRSVYNFVFSDNGAGLPAEIHPENAESMGLKIVWLLTRQIGGTLTIDRKKGTSFRIELPA